MASNQVYSQGFNFSSFIQKGVDPRTGQYTCAITLYEAPAQARNCPPLKLSISYNPLNSSQDIGLGKGWSFNNLSYYQHRQSNTKSLFLSTGEHFQVTETSSGSVTVKDRKLKSFLFKKKEDDKGKKTYQIIHKSGQIEVLHNTNDTYNITVPVKIYAANGRLLKLKWTRFGEQPRLSQIQEGSQVLLELKYSDSQVTIVRSPNTAEASTSVLVRRTNQLVELKLPREKSEDVLASWKFTYKSFNNGSIICLSTVSSPAGLLEQVQYKSDGHRLPEGAPYETIPYVISHTVQPRGQQPAIKTTYSYSHRNFLGYDGGVRWKGGEDNLYRVPDEYKYTSTVQMEGGAKTEYTYNKFHLIIDTLRRKGSKEVTQHIEYYALKNKGFKDQPAQYQLPKIARTTYRYTSAKKQEVSRTETSRYSFDEWGNPTSAEEPNGIKTDRVYYPAAGEKDTTTGEVYCPANPHLFQLYLKQETVTPAASEYTTPTRSKHYTYRELPTAAGALTGSFVVALQIQSLEDNQCVFSTQYTYTNQPATEDHGRLQQQTTSLFEQFKYSTITDWMYQYDPNNSERLTQTTQTRTFDGHTIQDETSYSRYSGLALTHKDQAGVDTVFEYNKLNRLVKTTLAPGTPYQATRQYEYGALSGESGYQLTLTDAKGVRTRYITDGLERLVRVEKQDDDGSWDSKGAYSGTFRLVQKRNYNTLGQHIETVDIDWLRSNQGEPTKQRQSQRMKYDDWGQVCKITQNTGVVISSLTDPVELTCTEGVEGEGETKIQSNLFGAPTQMVLLKRDGTVYSKFEYAYDGLGRLVKQKDQLGRTTQYQADCFDRSIQTREPDGRIINTQYATQSAAALPVSVNVNDHAISQQSFDGLCRVTSRKVGVRTTAQSYQGNAPKPSWITTPKGGQYNLTHEPVWDYALTKLTSSDSSNAYSDTDLTQVVQITNTNSTYPPTIDLAYDENGCLTRDERGRILEYDTLSRLSTVRDANTKEILAQYRYDSAGKLVCQEVPGKSKTYLHYRANALVALTVGGSKVSYISDGQVYWGQSLQQDGQIHTQLWSSDAHQSILAWLDTQQSEVVHHQSYTHYGGSAAAVSSIGFNGQWRDPVTGWYHLGNGYRVYNPVLMRFHTPDRWSPFTSGEINPYAYCLGDPINRIDPSGHLSIFGIDFSNRDLAVMGVGLVIGILVGILTAGAGFAIAAGVASDVATGFLYDVTSGKSPTWASVGTDALYGIIDGIAGEALGVGLKAASRGLSKILGRSASLTITEAESQSVRRLPALEANVIGRGRLVGAPAGEDYFEMAYINNLEGVPGHDALVTHGNWVGQLMCWNATRGEFFMTDAARVARYNLVRNANPELRRMANAFGHVDDRPFTLLACHGATSAGQVLANVLNRDVRCFYGRLQPSARFRNWDQAFHRLQREGGIEDVFGPVECVIRRPQGPPEPMEIL